MKEICANYGMQAFSPVDWAAGVEQIETENPYVWAQNLFRKQIFCHLSNGLLKVPFKNLH